jgi:hypothetical protein
MLAMLAVTARPPGRRTEVVTLILAGIDQRDRRGSDRRLLLPRERRAAAEYRL